MENPMNFYHQQQCTRGARRVCFAWAAPPLSAIKFLVHSCVPRRCLWVSPCAFDGPLKCGRARTPQIGKFSHPNRFSTVAQKFPKSHENLSARCDTPWQKANTMHFWYDSSCVWDSMDPGYKSEVKIHWPETAAFLFDTPSQTWKMASVSGIK
jgi:hypothetical protein